MALGAVLAAALTDHTAHPYGLFVGGVDVIRQPGTGGSLYGTPIEFVAVAERGPGAVSSMEFVIEDPSQAVTLAKGQEVQFWDLANTAFLFRGYVDHWTSRPLVTGRVYNVSATGVEAWLDWLLLTTAFTVNTSFNVSGNIETLTQSIPSPLVCVRETIGGYGSRGAGIATGLGPGATNTSIASGTIAGGTTLRETIRAILALGNQTTSGNGSLNVSTTVDFYLTLRVWANDDANYVNLTQPDDYTTLTVNDVIGGAIVAEGLQYSVEPDDICHEVYIAGGNAAGSGLFGDGTGIRGRMGYVADAAILTAADATIRAFNFLATESASVRGTFSVTDFTPVTTVHAGSVLNITDSPTAATGQYRIFGIDKTFNPSGRQNWTVSFGGLPPSGATLIRQLTRGTLI